MASLKERRSAMIALHKSGKRPCKILKCLGKTQYSKLFIQRTLKRYKEMSFIENRPRRSQPPPVMTARVVKKVASRLRRNPKQSLRKIAQSLKVNRETLRKVVKLKLRKYPFKIKYCQELSVKQKKMRREKAKLLLLKLKSDKLDNTVFSDEKKFTVRQVVNKQNDRIWWDIDKPQDPKWFRATKKQGEASLLVWAGVCSFGRTPLIFIKNGQHMTAKIYQKLVLNDCLQPWNKKQFKSGMWLFQQDRAPCHKAKSTQDWLQQHIPDFILSSDWSACSPNLNPLDYHIWSYFEAKVCSKKHNNLTALKQALQ